MKAKFVLVLFAGMMIGYAGSELASASSKPPAYLVVEYEITEPTGWQKYLAGSRNIDVERKFLARHAKAVSLSGETPKWIGIVQFPSIDDALAYDASPEYTALKPVRDRSTHWRSYVIEGLPD